MEVWGAVVALFRGGLVGRRRTPHGRSDPHPGQGQSVVGAAARGTIGEAGAMEACPQEIAAGIAREDPARPIAAMRRGCEPDDVDPRIRVTEAGQRPAPVRLVTEAEDL